jgi:hypothetical protein
MAAAFHYAVKVKLIRYETQDDIDFINYEKVFENENPILARQEAFKEYEEWIKDLYTGIGKTGGYITDKQARIDLQKFTTPSGEQNVQIDENQIDFRNSFGYGIGVYFIIDLPFHQSWESHDMYDKKGDEHLLHGIGTTDKYNDPLEISDALNSEMLYYEHYNYDKSNFERKAHIYDWDKPGIDEIHFLETPFDWTGFDLEPEEEPETIEQNTEQRIEEIIANGEGNKVEFKPALLYNFKTDKAGISVKGKIATAICAFLNSNGGFLFIGLDDNGKTQGLGKDFSLSNGKKPRDFFQNEFDQMIEYFLSFSVKANITGQFYERDGKDIFIVIVEPSNNRAIFVKGQNGKEFWVRGNAGNRQLTDIEELANYCIDRWTNLRDRPS